MAFLRTLYSACQFYFKILFYEISKDILFIV